MGIIIAAVVVVILDMITLIVCIMVDHVLFSLVFFCISALNKDLQYESFLVYV